MILHSYNIKLYQNIIQRYISLHHRKAENNVAFFSFFLYHTIVSNTLYWRFKRVRLFYPKVCLSNNWVHSKYIPQRYLKIFWSEYKTKDNILNVFQTKYNFFFWIQWIASFIWNNAVAFSASIIDFILLFFLCYSPYKAALLDKSLKEHKWFDLSLLN